MAEVDTITVLDSAGVPREVPTLLSLEEKIDTLTTAVDALMTDAELRASALDAQLIDPDTSLPVEFDDVGAHLGSIDETAPVTDTSSSGLNGRLQRIAQRITAEIALLTQIEANTAVADGALTDAELRASAVDTQIIDPDTSLPLEYDDVGAHLGSIDETAPITDIASSGLNGRLQRLAQRLTSLIALVPTALTGSGNLKIAIQEAVPAGTNLVGKVDHATTGIGHGVTTVTTAGTDVVLAGSTVAKWVTIQSQTDNTGKMAVGATGVDATIATGTGVLLNAGDSITLPIDNLADIFIDSTVNGEGVRYTYGS